MHTHAGGRAEILVKRLENALCALAARCQLMDKRQCLVDGYMLSAEGASDNSFLHSSILLIFQQAQVGNRYVYFAWS